MSAEQVVVATGAFQMPARPQVAARPFRDVGSRCTVSPTDARLTSRAAACSWSAAGTRASRSRRSCRRVTRCTLAIGSRQTPLRQRLLGRDLFWWLTKLGLLDRDINSRFGGRAHNRDTLIRSSPRELRRRYGVTLKPRVTGGSGRTVGVRRRK